MITDADLAQILAAVQAAQGPAPAGEGFPLSVATSLRAGNTIINSAGEFVYSANPALGNLIASQAQAGGTDQFGNAYLAGLTGYFAQLPALVQLKTASAASGTTLSFSLATPTTAGNTLIVVIASFGTTANPSVSAVTIGGGADHFAAFFTEGTSADTAIAATWADISCVGGQTAIAITASGGTGSQAIAAAAMEWQNISATDLSSGGKALSGPSWSSGTTGTPAVPVEVQIGAFAAGNPAFTLPGSPWVNTSLTQATGGFELALSAGYQLNQSRAPATYAGTYSSGWVASVATFQTGGSLAAVQIGTNEQLGFYSAAGPGGPWSLVDSLGAVAGNLVLAGGHLLAANPAASPAAETWHSIPLAAGWTQTGGQMLAAYRLLPDGNVQIQGSLTHAAFTAATTLSTALPTQYRPVTRQFIPGTLPGDAALDIPTSGVLAAQPGTLASCTACRFNGTYQLNN